MTETARDLLTTFLDACITRTFKKGEIIIFQGEAPRNAFIIKSGVVKSYNLSVAGDEKPIGFYMVGDSFPGAWIYGKTPSAVYYYEAFSEQVILYLVPREKYAAFIKKSARTTKCRTRSLCCRSTRKINASECTATL